MGDCDRRRVGSDRLRRVFAGFVRLCYRDVGNNAEQRIFYWIWYLLIVGSVRDENPTAVTDLANDEREHKQTLTLDSHTKIRS